MCYSIFVLDVFVVSVLDNCKDSAARDIDDKSDKKVSNDSDSDNDADSSSSSMSSDDGLFEMPLHSWISFNGTFATMQSLVRLRHKFMAYFLKMLKNPSRNTTEEDHVSFSKIFRNTKVRFKYCIIRIALATPRVHKSPIEHRSSQQFLSTR